tara:strand:- start:1418 stop:1843 length:426 start_codon:yes stop_codon:yes gene_type:complete
MSDWLMDDDGKIAVDHVLHTETLRTDLRELGAAYDLAFRFAGRAMLAHSACLLAPVMGACIQCCDDAAGGLFKKTRDQRMHQSGTSGRKQKPREFQRKGHMFKERLIYFGGVVQKYTCDHCLLSCLVLFGAIYAKRPVNFS